MLPSRSTPISSRRTSRTSIPKTSASSRPDRALARAGLLLLLAAGPAAAQQGIRLDGRVLLGRAADSVPLAGAWVVLHEVTMAGGGPLDSLRAGRDGAFRLGHAAPDTTALYMASTTYLGLTYFSQVVTGRDSTVVLEPLVVYDTSSTGPAIAVSQRHIIVRNGEAGGRRSVLELVALANDGNVARIAGEPPRPTWVGRLPAGVSDFEVGQGDLSSEAVRVVGDSVVVTAPVPPGVKQLVFSYTVPAGDELRLPMDQAAERLLVLLEDTTVTVAAGPLERRGVEVFNEQPFAVFSGVAPADGGAMVFRFSRSAFSPNMVVLIVVGLAGALLLLAIPLLRRTTPARLRAHPPDTPEALARTIAALDATYERGSRGPEETAAWQAERAALKARLGDALARGPDGR
jgi:hypothetical protein